MKLTRRLFHIHLVTDALVLVVDVSADFLCVEASKPAVVLQNLGFKIAKIRLVFVLYCVMCAHASMQETLPRVFSKLGFCHVGNEGLDATKIALAIQVTPIITLLLEVGCVHAEIAILRNLTILFNMQKYHPRAHATTCRLSDML